MCDHAGKCVCVCTEENLELCVDMADVKGIGMC